MRKFLQFTFSLLAMLMVTINANAWKFTSATPAAGEVESIDRIVLNLPADAGWLNEFSATFNLTDEKGNVTPCNFSTMTVGIVDTDATFKGITEPGTYTLTIPAGSLHYLDANWAPAEANEAQTFTWTIKGQGSSAEPWTFAAVDPAEGTVTSVKNFTFTMPTGTTLAQGGYVDMMCPDGQNHQVLISGNSANPTGDTYIAAMETPGTYTMSIEAGALKDNANTPNAAMTYTWTIGSSSTGWSFTGVTPAEGEVESLYQIAFSEPAGTMWVDELSAMPINLVNGNGDVVAVYNMADNYSQQVAGTPMDPVTFTAKEITEPGTYTMTIPAGTFHINGEGNAEITATWTIPGSNPPAGKDYTVSYDKANTTLTIAWPEGTVLAATDVLGSINMQIIGYDGAPYTMVNYSASNEIVSYPTLADGEYTLAIEAGQFTINGTPNEAISETFTVGGGGGGGGQQFDGDPFHETIFESGVTAVTIPYSVDNDNVTITTEGRPFLDTTIDVGYNMNSEKELNWKNGTKFIITAKKDINKVIFVPTADSKTAVAYASATGGDGEYTNGVWEGKLAAGETLTLTANDGINIKEFYICYNGDDFDPTAGGGDEKGVITIQYPVENQLIEKQVDGGKFCVFTTNKEYAQVTIEVRNSNPDYDNLYKFPTRMVDNMGEKSDNLHVGENTIYAATPGGGTAGKGDDWYWFKGDSYTMIVKGFVNPWDTDPDAVAEVNFVGNGKEHEAESIINLLNITPATSMESIGTLAMVNGVITLEFDGPVTSVKAVTPEGMGGNGINHSTAAKAGSDNKVWEINLGDQSSFATSETEGNPIIEIDVTAKAADGIVVLSNTRADRGLELKYELVAGAGPTPSAVTLGSPVWSIAENAEIDATTSSINIKFPNATNVEGTYTLEVAGTIGDKQFNLSNVSGTGTMADGADIAVSLSENKGYNLVIGSITVKNGSEVLYSTDMANYQLNFGTKAAQGGGGDGEITVSGDNICTIFTFVNETDVAPSFNAPITVNGTDMNAKFEMGQEWNEVYFIPEESLADGKYDVVFTAGSLMLDSTTPNATDYSVTFYVVDGAVTMTAPVGPQPSEVVIYDENVDTHTHNTELNFSKNGVTLISETTGSSFVVSNFKPGTNTGHLRLFEYNTLKFSADREIEKIEFVPVVSSAKWSAKSVSTGSFADNVWTGSATNVDLILKGTNMDVAKIIVTLKSDATGIQNVTTVENGKMFNLAGQQVKSSAKGIVIMNGKKYVVK